MISLGYLTKSECLDLWKSSKFQNFNTSDMRWTHISGNLTRLFRLWALYSIWMSLFTLLCYFCHFSVFTFFCDWYQCHFRVWKWQAIWCHFTILVYCWSSSPICCLNLSCCMPRKKEEAFARLQKKRRQQKSFELVMGIFRSTQTFQMVWKKHCTNCAFTWENWKSVFLQIICSVSECSK